MKKFEAVDYFNIIDLLNEEEKLVQVSVRTFVDAEVIPIIEEYYQEAKFPFQLIPKLAELGVFGMTLPEKYGCAGMNNLAYGLVNQELERGDSGLSSFL